MTASEYQQLDKLCFDEIDVCYNPKTASSNVLNNGSHRPTTNDHFHASNIVKKTKCKCTKIQFNKEICSKNLFVDNALGIVISNILG